MHLILKWLEMYLNLLKRLLIIYYGGTIAAPVVGDLFKNILPYLGIPAEEEESVSPSPNGMMWAARVCSRRC